MAHGAGLAVASATRRIRSALRRQRSVQADHSGPASRRRWRVRSSSSRSETSTARLRGPESARRRRPDRPWRSLETGRVEGERFPECAEAFGENAPEGDCRRGRRQREDREGEPARRGRRERCAVPRYRGRSSAARRRARRPSGAPPGAEARTPGRGSRPSRITSLSRSARTVAERGISVRRPSSPSVLNAPVSRTATSTSVRTLHDGSEAPGDDDVHRVARLPLSDEGLAGAHAPPFDGFLELAELRGVA